MKILLLTLIVCVIYSQDSVSITEFFPTSVSKGDKVVLIELSFGGGLMIKRKQDGDNFLHMVARPNGRLTGSKVILDSKTVEAFDEIYRSVINATKEQIDRRGHDGFMISAIKDDRAVRLWNPEGKEIVMALTTLCSSLGIPYRINDDGKSIYPGPLP